MNLSVIAVNSSRRNRAVLATAASITFLVALDSSLLNIALPAIRNSFPSASTNSIAWVINIYSLTLAAMLIPAGYLADRWGRKRLLSAGVGIFLLGCISCGASGSIAQLLVARLVQAVGGAMALPASLTVILTHFVGSERACSVGKWSTAGALAAAAGPPLGAVIMHYGSWRILFFLHAPICVWTLVRCRSAIVNSTGNGSISRLFLATPPFSAGTGLFFVAFASDFTSANPLLRIVVIACAAAFIALAVALVRKQTHFLRSFDRSAMALTGGTTFCFGAVFGSMFVLYDFALVYQFHFSISMAAAMLGAIPLLSIPVARNAGKFHQWCSLQITLLAGATALVLAVLLSFMMLHGSFLLAPSIMTVVFSSVGIGLCFPTLSITAVKNIHADYFAFVTGVNQSCRHLGTVIGVAAVGLMLGSNMPVSFAKAWWLLIGFAAGLLALAIIFWLEGALTHDQELGPKLASQPQH